MNKVLSVIIPAYNRAQTIARCIGSIQQQTYRNLEIILIDDGSKDQTSMICEEFAQKDPRIQVFRIENSGASAARKFGIAKAGGRYVTFVDSDDWIESDMYEKMLEKCEACGADVVTSGITLEKGDVFDYEMDTVEQGFYEKSQIREEILQIMMFDRRFGKRGITGSLCNKIFLKERIEDAFAYLQTSVTYGDDAIAVYSAMANADRLYVCQESWYHYCVHEDSLVQSHDRDSFEKILLLKENLTSVFYRQGILDIMQPQIEQYIRPFLRRTIQKLYGISMEQVLYLFPYEAVPAGSRIIIYGAGAVGNSYRSCLENGNYAVLVAWVDINYHKLADKVWLRVESPDVIFKIAYDYIVIAVESEAVADNICKGLASQGVLKDRLIWVQPRKIGC